LNIVPAAQKLSALRALFGTIHPEVRLEERVIVSVDALTRQDLLAEGWVYRRAEP
jgi:hypothetical protein